MMKLSEAIREGSKLRPQGFWSYFEGDRSDALGAAIEVLFGVARANKKTVAKLQKRYPLLIEPQHIPVPLNKCSTRLKYVGNLRSAIQYRNDVLTESREQIADWVATLEN